MEIAKYKISEGINYSFTLDLNNVHTYNEYDKNEHLDQLILNSVNPIIDSEKVLYYPIQVDELVFYIKENNVQKYYSDLGFTQDDVNVNSNRFKNTQLRINFFDSPNPSNQQLVYQLNLNTQGNEYQRDSEGFLFPVTALPLIFNIETSRKNLKKRKNSLGYGIPFFKNPINYNFPIRLYASFFLLNALNGRIHRLYCSDQVLNMSNLYQYLYVNYTLNTLNGKYFYTLDSTDRLINTTSLKKEITLNILNVS